MSFPLQETAERCARISTQLEQASQRAAQNDHVFKATLFIQVCLQRDLSVTEVADALHLSVSRFSALFAQVTGMPPGRYIKWSQMEMARQLLADGLPTAEVMARAGIKDLSHFWRDFKRLYGITPGQYPDHCQRKPDNNSHFVDISDSYRKLPAANSAFPLPEKPTTGQSQAF